MMHLSYRVMSPAVRAEPVTAREEIRLEDRLQHQLQRCLDHPVTDRRNAQVTDLAACLGYRAPPHWQWPEGTSFKILTQFREESFHPAHHLDVTGRLPVHTSGACSLVVPHPIPGHQEEPRIGDKIEQIVEPAMRIITSPTVQLVLDIQYPDPGPHQSRLQFVGIHQRDLLTFRYFTADLLAPFAMCVPLTRPDYYGASAPSHTFDRRRIYPTALDGFQAAGAMRDGSRVHRKPIDQLGTQLCPGSIAMVTPQAFAMASPPAR